MKKKTMYIVGAIVVLGVIGNIANFYDDTDVNSEKKVSDTKKTATTSKSAATKKPIATKVPKTTKKPTIKKVKKHRKNMYGISNKKAPGDLSIQKMNNDATGNFRYCMTTDKKHIEDYALDYYKKYMKSSEIHYIVNFTYNITVCITDLGDRLDLTVTQYVSKEEHDATTIGSGTLLSEFHVYLDNGDIEQIQ